MTHPIIIAAATTAEESDPGIVRFRGVAYSGGVLRVAGYRDGVVIDLDTLPLPAGPIPLTTEHGASLAARLGSATVVRKGATLLVAGTIVSGTPNANRVIALLRSGAISLSVGAVPGRLSAVGAGQSVKVNGQAFAGPVEVAHDARLHEVAVVGVPGDPDARAIAAQRKDSKKMEVTTTSEVPAPPTIATMSPTETERQRVRVILATFKDLPGHDKRRDELIADGASVEMAQGVALEIIRASRAPAGAPVIFASTPESDRDPAAILASGVAQMLGASSQAIRAAKLPEHSDVPTSLIDFAARCIRADGRTPPGSTDRVVRAAFSSNSFTTALASALEVIALQSFQASPEAALQIAKKIPVSDFRAQTIARLNGVFTFREVANGGELKHGQVKGDTSTIKLRTHGTIITLTREDVINDSRGLLQEVPAELGREAGRTVGDAFATALANTAFFHVDHGNVMSGGDSALSLAALSEAVRKLRVQTSADGRALNLTPKTLLVSAALEATARQILSSTEIGRSDGGPNANPMHNIANLLIDARLGAKQWYLFAAPENGAALLATLNGALAPVIESVELPADKLGVGWRGYFDFAVGLHEHRAAVRSLGE